MRNTTKTLMRLTSAVLISFLVLLPAPALAHDTLLESTPADGTTVTSDENFVSFRFSNEVLETAAFIAIIDPSGTEVSLADTVIAGDTVSRSYTPTVTGTYSASYRVTSSDGHPIDGTITFDYQGPTSPTTSDSPEQRADAPENAQATASDNDSGTSMDTIMIVIAVGALLSVLLVAAIRKHRSRH